MDMEKARRGNEIIHDFTTGSIPKQLVLFALPLFLSSLLQVVYTMVDLIVVGQVVGPAGTSGVTIGGDVLSVLTFYAIGFSNGGQIIIAQFLGAGRKETVGKVIGNLFSILILGAVVFGVFSFAFRTQLLLIMNTPAESWDQAYNYLTVCSLGIVFIYGYNVMSAVLRGLGDSRHPLIFVALAAALNIILDLVLVAGLGLESFGAALATIASQGLSFALCLSFLWRRRYTLGVKLDISCFRFQGDILASITKLGVPMAIKSAAISTSKLFVNSWVNTYGVAVSSAAGIDAKFNSIMNQFSNSLNSSGGVIIGQNIGAEKYDRVKRTLYTVSIMSFSIATVVVILVVFAVPRAFFGLFTSDAGVMACCMSLLPVLFIASYGFAARCPMNALINGSGNARLNFVVALLDGIVARIGFSLLFGLVLDFGWVGFLLGDAVAGYMPFVIGMLYYWSGKWKTRKYLIKD